MRLNLRTLLAVIATTLLVLSSVDSFPLDNPDDIALKKRINAPSIDTGFHLAANEAYSIATLPRAPGAPKLRPKPKPDGQDVPKGPGKPDNPAIGGPKGSKCPRDLQGRCSDSEEMDIDEPVQDEDVDKGYDYYRDSGIRKIDDMNAKMEEIRADPNRNHDKPVPQLDDKQYRIRETGGDLIKTPLAKVFDSVVRVFDDLGLRKDATVLKGAIVDAVKLNSDMTEKKLIVGENYVSTQGDGVIVAKWNNMMSHDISAVHMRWSDLTVSVLSKTRGPGYPGFADIKYIIRDGINNAGTKRVINKVHAELPNNVLNGKGTFDLASPNQQEVEAAKTLIGTPNGTSIFFLIEFPKLFGNQRVKRVHTWSYDQKWAMAFELGPM